MNIAKYRDGLIMDLYNYLKTQYYSMSKHIVHNKPVHFLDLNEPINVNKKCYAMAATIIKAILCRDLDISIVDRIHYQVSSQAYHRGLYFPSLYVDATAWIKNHLEQLILLQGLQDKQK